MILLLKAFAGGAVALTGVEAIANGVPAFKPPEAKNAANTMTMMAILLGVLFIGITFVGNRFGIQPTTEGGPTAIAQVSSAVFGPGSPLFVLFQIATALILFLAVNTSFNAFPRLAAILAEDGFMPRQFSIRGDRLAFSWGIVVLAGVAATLLVIFQGDVHLLIPLYSVGVFVCFTLSQTGMVRHWLTVREPGWRWRLALNGLGAVMTFVVLVVVASVKFAGGAWLVLVLIPILVALMLFINRQYAASARQLAIRARTSSCRRPAARSARSCPSSRSTAPPCEAINVARSISEEVLAVYISDDPEDSAEMRARWERQVPGVSLVIVESPYRALAGPLDGVPGRARSGLATGQAGTDHVRRHSRVRGAATGGSGSCTTSPRASSGGSCSAVRTQWSWTSRTAGTSRAGSAWRTPMPSRTSGGHAVD